MAEELLRRRAKLLVVACNAATAAALGALRQRMMETTLGVEVISVVTPEAMQAVASDPHWAHRAACHTHHGRQWRL